MVRIGKMTKIVWFSRHEPLPSQIKELERIFGQIEIIRDPNPFSSAEEVVERFKKQKADEMVIVAPLSVIARICEYGIKPLWAEMEITDKEHAEIETCGRYFRFKRFRRIKGIKIEFDEVI